MIQPPKENIDRGLWRAVAEAATQFNPVTAALACLYQTTHPSQFQKDVERWHEAVSDAVNDHEVRLQALEARHQPKLLMSDGAAILAVWFAETSTYGLEYGSLPLRRTARLPMLLALTGIYVRNLVPARSCLVREMRIRGIPRTYPTSPVNGLTASCRHAMAPRNSSVG